MDSKYCLNCEVAMHKGDKFCSNCGQTSHVHHFTLAHFFHEVFHAFTHADKGIFYLLKELAIRPGIVARAYIAGKRKRYFNPFTFFLILAAIYILSENAFTGSLHPESHQLPAKIEQIQDSEKRLEAATMYIRAMEVNVFVKKHSNVLAMLAVPLFAFFFWIIFLERKYNYAEHLVANVMFVSFSNLAFVVIVFPLEAITQNTTWLKFIPLIGFVIQLIYYTIAYKQFIELKGALATLKVALATLIGLVLWVTLTASLMALYVYRNAHFLDYFGYMNRG